MTPRPQSNRHIRPHAIDNYLKRATVIHHWIVLSYVKCSILKVQRMHKGTYILKTRCTNIIEAHQSVPYNQRLGY